MRFDQWKNNMAEGLPTLSWVVFEDALLGRFIPQEIKVRKSKRFY